MSGDPLLRQAADNVLPNHVMHQGIRARGEPMQAVVRQGVPRQHDRRAAGFDPKPARRRHRPLIDGRHPDGRRRRGPRPCPRCARAPRLVQRGQIGVVSDPVADVVTESFQRRLDHFGSAGRSEDDDVVAVQMGEQQCGKCIGAQADCGCAAARCARSPPETSGRRPVPGWMAGRGSGPGSAFRCPAT
jgi:hypothetical protein